MVDESRQGSASGDVGATTEQERFVAGGEPEWRLVHQRLCAYAAQRGALDAAESFDLVSAERLKVYSNFGCVTLWEYLERLLGYGPHAARERMRVARALVGLPRVSAGLARGALNFSAVREITRVATADTEEAWLAAAKDMTAHQIEGLVAGHAAGDLPDDPTRPELRTRLVRIELPTEVLALLREARSVIASDQGSEVSDAKLIEALCRQVLDPANGRQGPPHQIAYRQCPNCKRGTQLGAGRELDIRPDVLERAACDARVIGDLDDPAPARATTTVTARLREQVFARDGERCTVPGCRSARNLDVHHIIEEARGGPSALWNLTLMCSGHHAILHEGLLSITGRAPYDLTVRWTYGPPVPVGADAATRAQRYGETIDAILTAPPDVRDRDVPRGTLPSRASPFAPPEPAVTRPRSWRREDLKTLPVDRRDGLTPPQSHVHPQGR